MAWPRKDTTGQILLSKGLITEETLNRALEEHRSSGKRLGDVLVDMGAVSRSQVLAALSEQLAVDIWNPGLQPPTSDALRLLPEAFARSRKVLPVSVRGQNLLVAMEDPTNLSVLEEIRVRTGLQPIPLLSSAEAIEQALDRYYTLGKIESEVRARVSPVQSTSSSPTVKEAASPAANMVNHLLNEAIRFDASDIHIEPLEDRTRLRYRIDGVLWEIMSVPAEAHAALVTRLKVMAGVDVAESRLPQDGRFTFQSEGVRYNVRLSTMPVEYGEKVVLRILGKVGAGNDLYSLGFSPDFTEKLVRVLRRPSGLILVAGPSGSGKSTTLAACLNFLNDGHKNIVTVEDPVEHIIPGVNQVQVNAKAGLTFPVVLRHVLRQDPDCIMIGEIRDSETVNIAIRAALTGHLVLATLHSNDSIEALVRLKEMGCDPYLITATLAGVVSQRLLRRLCPHCKERYELDERTSQEIGHLLAAIGAEDIGGTCRAHEGFSIQDLERKEQSGSAPGESRRELPGSGDSALAIRGQELWKAVGCDRCSGRGYLGRKVVGEILVPGDELRSQFIKGASLAELRRIAMKGGFRPLISEACNVLLAGETSVEDLIRVFYPESRPM